MPVYSTLPLSIVLDSTAFGDKPRSEGSLFEQLADYIERSGATLFIPTVVIQETRRTIDAEVRRSVQAVGPEFRSLSVRGALPADFPELAESDELVKRAQASFAGGIAKLSPVEPEIPNVTHEEILDRLHEGSKPFGGDGDMREDGYRDYLTWKTVLAIAAVEDPRKVAFISNDKRAFEGNTSGELAQELGDDTVRAGVTVVWRHDLWNFLQRDTAPWQQSVEQLRDAILASMRGALRDFLFENVRDTPAWYFLDPDEIGLHPRLDDLTIVGLTSIGEIALVDVLSLVDGVGVARLSAKVEFHLNQMIDADAPPDFDESDIYVALDRLSSRTALAQVVLNANATFDVTYDIHQDQVTPVIVEIEDVDFYA
jgi:hypothetical protein